jgi:two-component system sensor histidine kinase/response regulator
MINPQTLEELKSLDDDGSNATLKELINLYLSSTPQKITRMEDFLQSQDYVALKKEAHSLRSSSLSLGAELMGELSSKIEYAAPSASAQDFMAVMEEVKKEFQSIDTELKGQL